jgi:hypothetical protein
MIRLNAATGSGFSGAPTRQIVPSSFRSDRYALTSCGAETQSRMKSKLRVRLHLGGVLGDDDLVCAEALAVLDLRR